MSEEYCPSCGRHSSNSGACPDDWHTKYIAAADARPRVTEHVHWESNIGVSHGDIAEERVCADDPDAMDYRIELCDGMDMGWMHVGDFHVIRPEDD